MKKKKGLIITLAVIAALILALVLAHALKKDEVVPANGYVTTNPSITQGDALVSAHRSGGAIFPENTLMAFEGCVESDTFKTDIFEFDLHLTKDNVLVLLHDKNFDRTSNSAEAFGAQEVLPRDKTFEELQVLNLGENFEAPDGTFPYRGLRGDDIPQNLRVVRLETVLDYLLADDSDCRFIIEIKDGGETGKRAADELYKILSERNLLEKVIVGTFQGEITEYLDENYDDMLRSAGIAEVLKFYLAAQFGIELDKEDIKYDALQIPYKQFVLNLGTQDIINRAHKYDIAVQYWTINDPEEIRELNERGADAIMSDDPEMAYGVIHPEAE